MHLSCLSCPIDGSRCSGVESGFLDGKEYWLMIFAMHDDSLFGVAQAQLILPRDGLNSCKSFFILLTLPIVI